MECIKEHDGIVDADPSSLTGKHAGVCFLEHTLEERDRRWGPQSEPREHALHSPVAAAPSMVRERIKPVVTVTETTSKHVRRVVTSLKKICGGHEAGARRHLSSARILAEARNILFIGGAVPLRILWVGDDAF